MNPSNSCSTMLIFWIGQGFLTNILLTSPKLLRKLTVLFFFGIINKGLAHSNAGGPSNTPSLTSLFTSLIRFSLCFFGTGKAWPWYRDAPSFSWKETGFVFQSHKVLSKSNSVTSSVGQPLGACSCLWQPTGDLLYCIWHLIFELHNW